MSQPGVFGRRRTSIRLLVQVKNRRFERAIPFQGGGGIPRVDFLVQPGEITLSAGCEANEVCHFWLRNPRKTHARDGPSPALRLPYPGESLLPHRRGRRCREAADR